MLVRQRLGTLELRHDVSATEPNKEKKILLRMMRASSFYTLFACFFEIFGPDIPDALLWKLEVASGEERGPTEEDLRELQKFFQLPGPAVISLTSNALEEFDVKIRDNGDGSTPGLKPQITLLAALIRLYDSSRGSDDIDGNVRRDSTSEDRAAITGDTHKQEEGAESLREDPHTIPLQSSNSHRSVNAKDRLPPESMRSYSPPPPSSESNTTLPQHCLSSRLIGRDRIDIATFHARGRQQKDVQMASEPERHAISQGRHPRSFSPGFRYQPRGTSVSVWQLSYCGG